MTEDLSRLVADRLHDIEAVTDAALSRLADQELLQALLERVKQAPGAGNAGVLLADRSARQLIATAASGIEEEVRQGVRVPLGTGFAGRVAARGEPVILDRVDHSTVRNPLLVDRGIKSLLGVPLFADGKVIGVLHVGSLSARSFGKEDVELLQLAADRAARALHSLMAREDAEAAVALQASLLPSAVPEVPGVSLSARYVTGAGNVGGDWYDVFVLPSGKVGVVVGDVAGSGLSAAVIMGRMRSALRAYVLETDDPSVALGKLDRKMQYFEPDAMGTVLYGVFEPGSGKLEVSSAGHLPPVLQMTGELAGLAERAAAGAQRLLANARRALRRADAKAAALAAAGLKDAAAGRRRGRLRRAVSDLAGLLEVTVQVAAQARQRLAGKMPAGATRRVSLHEPDARPIAKGRLGKPVEFGYKAQVTDNDDGVVLDYSVEQGNPADGPQLAPAIARLIKRTGKKPGTVTADRSYSEKAIEDDLRAHSGSATSSSRARAGPARPARPPNAGPRSGGPSSGEPEAKAGSAHSNANTDGTAPAWTAPKEPGPGPGTGSWPTTWSRSASWPADTAPASAGNIPALAPNSARRLFRST